MKLYVRSCCGSIMTVHMLGILDCIAQLGLFCKVITGKVCMLIASPAVGNVWCIKLLNLVLVFHQEHCSHYQCHDMFLNMQV